MDARDIIGQTPWHHALTGTWSPVSLAAAQLLLRSGGVCANARNRCGRTVLVELAMVGPAAMPAVQLALEAGADWTIADSDGNTPLSAANSNGHFGVAKLLRIALKAAGTYY